MSVIINKDLLNRIEDSSSKSILILKSDEV